MVDGKLCNTLDKLYQNQLAYSVVCQEGIKGKSVQIFSDFISFAQVEVFGNTCYVEKNYCEKCPVGLKPDENGLMCIENLDDEYKNRLMNKIDGTKQHCKDYFRPN